MPVLNDVLAGTAIRCSVQVVYDRAFFDALETPHKLFEPLCSYERYHELLDAADIALLPLEPTRFNQHKSDLKFIECAAHAVASLASPTVYDRTIIDGETGLIYHSLDEFERTSGSTDSRHSVPPQARRERPSLRCREPPAGAPLPRPARMVSPRCSTVSASSTLSFWLECRSSSGLE